LRLFQQVTANKPMSSILRVLGSGTAETTVETVRLSIAKPGCGPESTRVSNPRAEIVPSPCGKPPGAGATPRVPDVANKVPPVPPL